ncbi:MAG TPA: hypothetical protein VGQ62_18005 [Chloroflexota bacterium]|nr:hypothetical protein [Chloroflexota bacterium]
MSDDLRLRRFGHSYTWIVLGLALVALLSRVYTTNSLAGEPTSDEYLYAIHARDLARDWSSGQSVSLEDLGVEGRSVAVESAALSFIVPWDPLTVGRTMQALFNALCIPATFVLGRQIGLTRSAALVAAVLLMAVPEFQELAWRFWTDSQATFLSLVYLSALVSFIRRPAVLSGGLGLLCLSLLLLTKESAAVTFAPFLVLAIAIPMSRRLTSSGRRNALLAAGLVCLAFAGLGVLLARAPGDLARNALLQKTFGAGPLIFSSVRDAVPKIPDYSQQLVSLIGPTQLGTGFLWATLIGFAWLMIQSVVALVTTRPRLTPWVVGWLVAVAVWTPAMITPSRDMAMLKLSDPWVAVAAGGLMVAVGTVDLYLRNARRPGWGLALLGLVVLAVLAERLVIAVTPKVSNAALTFRSLMPIVPLFALVAGGGVWAAAGALALLIPTARTARAFVAVVGAALLVALWSPLLRERLSNQPLLGRVADRGADPDTPQGLRVEALVEAQSWLQANLQPTDLILTGIPRHLAWYADLGVAGYDNLIDLNSQVRTEEQKRQYILDRVGPKGVTYVVDFNVSWTDPGGDAARQWRQTYETLANRPNLEAAYVKRDKFGNPVLYVLRNHGYALAPGH